MGKAKPKACVVTFKYADGKNRMHVEGRYLFWTKTEAQAWARTTEHRNVTYTLLYAEAKHD